MDKIVNHPNTTYQILLRLEQEVQSIIRISRIATIATYMLLIVTLCWLTSIETRLSRNIAEGIAIHQQITNNKQDKTSSIIKTSDQTKSINGADLEGGINYEK